MALITCVECGNEFSDKAPACPKCGCPTSESTKPAEAQPEVSAEPKKETAAEQAARIASYRKNAPSSGQPSKAASEAARINSYRKNPSAGGPTAGTKPNGCAMGCGALLLGLLVLAGIGSMVGDGDNSTDTFDDISAKVYCRDLIKKQLRDPDSYKFEQAVVLSSDGQYGKARVYFRSKNGFGGYVRGSATCTAYDNNGSRWFRAVID